MQSWTNPGSDRPAAAATSSNLAHLGIPAVAEELADFQRVQVEKDERVVVSLRIVAQHRRLLVASKQRPQRIRLPEPELLAIAERQRTARYARRNLGPVRLRLWAGMAAKSIFRGLSGGCAKICRRSGTKSFTLKKRLRWFCM